MGKNLIQSFENLDSVIFNPRVGDYVLYSYYDAPREDNDIVKGYITKIQGKRAKVKVGYCHRKSEGVYTEEIEVDIDKLKPFLI